MTRIFRLPALVAAFFLAACASSGNKAQDVRDARASSPSSLRQSTASTSEDQPLSKEQLLELIRALRSDIQRGEYESARKAFDTAHDRAFLSEDDPRLRPLVVELCRLNFQAKELYGVR